MHHYSKGFPLISITSSVPGPLSGSSSSRGNWTRRMMRGNRRGRARRSSLRWIYNSWPRVWVCWWDCLMGLSRWVECSELHPFSAKGDPRKMLINNSHEIFAVNYSLTSILSIMCMCKKCIFENVLVFFFLITFVWFKIIVLARIIISYDKMIYICI